jgi:hypothetical protein
MTYTKEHINLLAIYPKEKEFNDLKNSQKHARKYRQLSEIWKITHSLHGNSRKRYNKHN